MRVLSYTHVYFGARELHARHTRVYGLVLSINTVGIRCCVLHCVAENWL